MKKAYKHIKRRYRLLLKLANREDYGEFVPVKDLTIETDDLRCDIAFLSHYEYIKVSTLIKGGKPSEFSGARPCSDNPHDWDVQITHSGMEMAAQLELQDTLAWKVSRYILSSFWGMLLAIASSGLFGNAVMAVFKMIYNRLIKYGR